MNKVDLTSEERQLDVSSQGSTQCAETYVPH